MQELDDLIRQIEPVDNLIREQAQHYIDGLIKPIGSLGKLETIAIQLSAIYRRLDWTIKRKKIVVMAADHGVFEERVAVTPKEVTAIQAYNTTRGLTGVCALAYANSTEVDIVDVGIDADPIPGVINMKLTRGSGNIVKEPAMLKDNAERILYETAKYAMDQATQGVGVIGVGELGIANTTPAAAIVSVMTESDPADIVGLGANYPSGQVQHKIEVVRQAIEKNRPDSTDPIAVMAKVGGYDLAGMTGLMLGAAAAGIPVVLDGFLSYASAMIACAIAPDVRGYLIPSHASAEKGSVKALRYLNMQPSLDMELRLGEGSGAALAMNLLMAAESMMKRMGRLADDDLDLPDPS